MEPLRDASVPPPIAAAVKGTVLSARTADFTGDGIGDYVLLVSDSGPPPNGERPLGQECWVSSAGRLLHCERSWYLDHDYRWFIDLTRDGIPEVVSAQGYADGIEYTVERIDTLTGNRELLFYFNPVLVVPSGERYWGYPWDLLNMQHRVLNGRTEVRATFDYRFAGDEEIRSPDSTSVPEWQVRVPTLLFDGITTQPQSRVTDSELQDIRWFTLDALVRQSRERPSQ